MGKRSSRERNIHNKVQTRQGFASDEETGGKYMDNKR
jgi:hypothetical protein